MIKKIISLLASCCCYSIILAQPAEIDVLHYRFEIGLSDQSDTVHGRASILVKFLQPGSQVAFDLALAKDGKKGMTVTKIDGPGLSGFTTNGDHIDIHLTSVSKVNDTATFVISYAGIPADGLIISKNKFGHRSFFSDNWPNRAHQWIPCVDDPADKAPVEFFVTAPAHYQVISNGLKIEETDLGGDKKLTKYQEDVPLPTKVMVIGVADFAVEQSGEVDGVPVYSWVFPENKDNGFHDYAMAKDILLLYVKYIGPFPYKKLANVQSKTIFGGMENSGAIFYFENSVTGKNDQESLLAHEIAHQWFGDMATEASFAHLWLSEGFATYFTHFYIETKYGVDSLHKEMQKDRREIIAFTKETTRPVVDSVSPLMQLLNANSYQKGGWILYMLRQQLGDSLFHQFIRSYYDTYKGKNATTEDLQAVAEKVSGKKLNVFFHQWLYVPGVPNLSVSWKNNEKGKSTVVTVEQTQAFVYQFPLEIQLTDAKGKETLQRLSITRRSETFTIKGDGKTLNIMADPGTKLLFEGNVKPAK
jgi:aminopeptidase N